MNTLTVILCFQSVFQVWRTWKSPLFFCLKAQFFQYGSGNGNERKVTLRAKMTDGFGMCLGTVTWGPSIGGRWERWMCKRTTATKPTPNKTQQNHSKTSQENYLRISWLLSCREWLRTKLHVCNVSSQWDEARSRSQVLMSHSEAVKTFHEICFCAKKKWLE